jgi:hypothetical protein
MGFLPPFSAFSADDTVISAELAANPRNLGDFG